MRDMHKSSTEVRPDYSAGSLYYRVVVNSFLDENGPQTPEEIRFRLMDRGMTKEEVYDFLYLLVYTNDLDYRWDSTLRLPVAR